MVTRSEAIANYLREFSKADLAALYHLGMECQVNVSQGDGKRVSGEYKGRQWHGWTDEVTTWKSFRIPYNANKDPEYSDVPLNFCLEQHAEGIGMTGWDWVKRASQWVAYDFDAIMGHSDEHLKKLSQQDLAEVQDVATKIPWVTVRKSTSGQGLHLYVFLDDVPTSNHHEHSALSRAILGKMSAITGYDFMSKVDVCGGNMWVWHKKMIGTNGLDLVKQGEVLKDIPMNWKDHVDVVSGRRTKVGSSIENIDELAGQQSSVTLDAEHKALLENLQTSNASHWWDQDHCMLITHTYALKLAHEALGLRGIFTTMAEGKEHGTDHNCFLFPLNDGAWAVRRYSKGVNEADTWEQDSNGWTKCFLNKEPNLAVASRTFNGIEDEGNKYVFSSAEEAIKAAELLGARLEVPDYMRNRETIIKPHKDGNRLVITTDRVNGDEKVKPPGWLEAPGGKWKKIVNASLGQKTSEVGSLDNSVRHVVSELGIDCGWRMKIEDKWHKEPLAHVKMGIESLGYSPSDLKNILGDSVNKPWYLTCRPFHPEYPGGRVWNMNAPQLAFAPNMTDDKLTFPTWDLILQHIGGTLDSCMPAIPWASSNGILTGTEYLLYWISSIIQFPSEPLPYLFLYGPQNSGKSILHEGLKLLFTSGYQRADRALTGSFNGEIEAAILCVIEEIDLNKNKQAYNNIKDWVTSPDILIHEKNMTPRLMSNNTHWIQCSNDRDSVPVFPGDTRITMIYVPSLKEDQHIPKREILRNLEKEAPDFLGFLLNMEIPAADDRLMIPVIETNEKSEAIQANSSLLEQFLEEDVYDAPGSLIEVSEFWNKFSIWLEASERPDWSKRKMSQRLVGLGFLKGRNPSNSQLAYGNISFDSEAKPNGTFEVKGQMLKREAAVDEN